MAANINTGIDEEELRRQREEAERIAREQQEAAKAAQEEAEKRTAEAAKLANEQGFRRTVQEKSHGIRLDLVDAGEIQNENLSPDLLEHLNEKNEQGELGYGTTWGAANQVKVDYDSIKDTEQAVFFATTIDTQEDKLTFFNEYAKKSGQSLESVLAYADDRLGTKIFATPQSNAGKRNAMMSALDGIGLFDIAGEDIDVYSADFDVLVQSLSNIADKGTREDAAAYLESLTKIKGSRFYGRTFDKEEVEYRNSADLPQDIYNTEIKEFGGTFKVGEGFAGVNAEQYLAKFQQIDAVYGDNPYAFRQVESALRSAYEKQTGYVAPKAADVRSILEQMAEQAAQNQPEEEKGWFESFIDAVWPFKKKEKVEPVQTGESSAPVEGKDYSVRDMHIASAGPSAGLIAENNQTKAIVQDVLGEEEKAEQEEPAPGMSSGGASIASSAGAALLPPDTPAQTEQPSGRWIDNLPGANAEPAPEMEIPEKKQEPMSEAEALKMAKAGRADELSEENYAKIKDVWENDTFRSLGLFGIRPTEQELYDQDQVNGYPLTEEERLERALETTNAYQLLGKTLGGAADTLNSGALPEDISLEGQLLLGDIINLVDRRVRGGRVHIPKGANKYEYAISQFDDLQKKAEQLSGLQARVNAIRANRAIEAAHAYDRAVESAEQAFIAGLPLTDEQVMLLTDNAKAASPEQVRSDKARRDMRYMLSDNAFVPYYKDDGKFWTGNSAAAQEGQRLKETQSDGKYEMYKYELREAAYEVIDDLTNMAYDHGMPLEKLMTRMGIGIDQVMDMAYNRIVSYGNRVLTDPEVKQTVEALSSGEVQSVGIIGAASAGMEHSDYSIAYHLLNAPYATWDALTYETRKRETYAEYNTKYRSLAAHMRRKDLLDYANSEEMPPEEAKALIEDVQNADNIFDIAFDIDPGWLASNWREAAWEYKKDLDSIEATIATMPEHERALAMGMSSVSSNLKLALVSQGVTIGAGVVGAPAWAARLLGAAPNAGMTLSQTLKDNEEAGLTPETAAWLAIGETAVLGFMESFGAEKSTADLLFSSALARNAMEATIRKTGPGALNVMGAMAKSAVKAGAGEAGEEIAQGVFSAGVDMVLPAIKGIEDGTITTPAQAVSSVLDEIKATDYAEISKELVTSGLMGFGIGTLVSLPAIGWDTYKAVTNVKLQNKFESIDIASQITHGEIPANDENIGRFIDAMRKDAKNPEFQNAYNKTVEAANQLELMNVAAMSGTGHDLRVAAVEESKKADAYEKKAESAHSAVETNKAQYARATKLAAEGNQGAMHTMEGFRTAWAKAQTTETENRQASEKAREKAAEYTSKWLNECRKVAKALSAFNKESATRSLINMYNNIQADEMEPGIAEAEANAEALAAEDFIEKNYKNASDADKDHIREIWGVPVGTKENVASETTTGAENAQVNTEAAEEVPAAQTEADAVTAPQTASEAVESQPAQTTAEQTEAPVQPTQTATQASEAPVQTAAPTPVRTGAERLIKNRKRQIKAAERFAGQVTRRFGVKTEIARADDERLLTPDGKTYVPALYNRKEDKILISENATQGDVIRAKIVHELTHRTEGTEAYKEFSKAVLGAYYKNDQNITAARNARKNLYASKGVQLDEAGIDAELVAYATEQLIGGNEEMVNRIVADNPSVARRIMDAIKAVLDRLTGVKGKDVDQLRAVENMFKKALDESQKQRKAEGVQHSIPDSVSPDTGDILTGTVGGDTVVQYSFSSWTPEEQNTVRSNLIGKGFDEEAVDDWIDNVNSVAAIVATDRDRLDFVAADNQVMLKPNAEYVKTLDASTLCAKRLLYQGTFNAIQHRLPNKVMTSDDLIRLRNMMAEAGYETPCGICYVESRRRNLGTFAKKWLDGYDAKGGYQPKLDDVTTTDGLERMRTQHPEVYDSFVNEMKRKGSNNPKVVQLRTDYRGDIQKLSKGDAEKIVKIGGLRVQSFSDFETPHLLDMMQAVLDMTDKGLTSQAYTKVPNFAWVFGDTGIKINLSLIAEGNGLDVDGNLIFSSYEGMDFDEAMRLRDRYSKNVGTILVGLSDAHIRAAMADDRIDFIIPFHKSGWGKRQLAQLSGMSGYMDYTRDQNERRVIGETKTGKPKTKNVEENFHPVDYWDYSLTGDQNAETYLRMCEEDGRIPKFSRFLTKDSDGHWVAPHGYWKLLIDFKMYDNDGVGAPQMPVQPNFNMTEAMRILDEYEGGADTLPVAHDIVERFVAEKSGKGDVQYSVDDSVGSIDESVDDSRQYGYDYLVSQEDMPVTKMPDMGTYEIGNRIDDRTARRDGIESAKAIASDASTSNRLFVDNRYTKTPLQVTTNALKHGIIGTKSRIKRNATAASVIGGIAQNAIPINELVMDDTDAAEGVKAKYLYMGMAEDADYYYPVALVVKNRGEDLGEVVKMAQFNGIEKRYLYSMNSAEYKKEPVSTVWSPSGDGTSSGSVISIADMLNIVKEEFGDGLSSDVLSHLGMERPTGKSPSGRTYTYTPQYSVEEPSALPDDDFLRAEIDAWRNNPNYSVEDADTGKRQFANQTIQNNQYIPDYIKQAFLNDPDKANYSRESNMRQLNAAWSRVNSEGYEAARDRLVNQETKFTTEDNADALILMRQALHDGDLDTLMAVATKYNTEGTDQAKALQIRRLMRTMTPTGFAQTVIQDVSKKIDKRNTDRPNEKRRRERESKKTKEDLNLGGLDDASASERLDRGESIEIDSKFGASLNDAKRALIKEFKLEKTTRPGDFYNWATTKQRMLEDILTTDDIWAKDSNGMDLVDRLVRMKHGDIVLTKADLEYITDQMAIFDRLADKNSREADLALARAHEAQGNVNGVTGRMKRRTWRYVSMLLSVPSAIRNVIGNTAQSMPNAVADGIAVELDRVISAIAGTDRTRAHISAKDRIEGWEAFRDEVFNTFRDYFVDKAITQHGEGRYNQSQIGRVYQHQSLETLRHLEGLLMSVGDRNFWKKKFLNSMAEQQHLAEINGTAFDVEAAMEIAEAEANYATFNEDSAIRNLMSSLTENIPFLDYLMPFTGVPTNIIKRQIQFSPIGIASTALTHGWRAVQGRSFDQRAFVDGMARGLTGSAMWGLGALLFKSGFLKLGTKDEEDDKSYGVRTAQGDQYGVYFTIGDENYSITTFSPAASALVAGAFVVDALGDNNRWYEALVNATLRNINEIFDASYMSSLADALNTSNGKTFTENLIPAIGSAMITQNIPAPLTHLASALDPYVRDTKDKDTLMEIVKTTMNKIPGARQLLPEKVDVAGRAVKNTKAGAAAFYDPFTTSYVEDDPALSEMIRLRDVLTEKGYSEPRAHMASDALSGRKNTLTQNKASYTVTPEEKESYRKLYGDLWRNGGITYDKKGNRVSITQGVEDLINSRAYQLMTPEEQAEAIKKILQKAKEGATYQIMNHK